MDLLKDIAEIVKDDEEHNVEVKVDNCGVTVYLESDPDSGENCVIPIHYSSLEEFIYIPHDEFVEKFRPKDFGIDLQEIKLIQKLMEYIENNKRTINKLCMKYDLEFRNEE